MEPGGRRVPLRPLPRIDAARRRGADPDLIERENLRRRHLQMQRALRSMGESRLVVLVLVFMLGYAAIAARMASIALSEAAEPRAGAGGAAILAQRADITDRRGRVLATNLPSYALYAQPAEMIEPVRAARELARIFPDLDAARLERLFTSGRKFVWLRRRVSPEQMQAVHDIGEPGLRFGPREIRLYPNGRLAAHVLGAAGFGREAVDGAEVVGRAGIEKAFDAELRDPARGGAPLELSLDLTAQAILTEVLGDGMRLMNARGAAGVLMDPRSGEILALVSLPDYDPNRPPAPPRGGDPAASPLFDRAVQGVYELGSVFKPLAVAAAIEAGAFGPDDQIDTRGPIRWGRFRIRDFHAMPPRMSVREVVVKSSNVGTARIAQKLGAEALRDFLARLGLTEPLPLELPEARASRPLLPPRWSELAAMTASYGHGIAVSPVHLAAAYAALANGGRKVRPTLLHRAAAPAPGPRVMSERTAREVRRILREVVRRGTATLAEVPGYEVAGKTGTADKPAPNGGYLDGKVIATFAAMFPAEDPAYVLVVTLDEPEDRTGAEPRRTAGWTAVPVAAEAIRRLAPVLGLRPSPPGGAGDEPAARTDAKR
ncbi:MAG: penicillin-binding protein 2 [Alphaproteobacteria bacterium]|nr:MAG: penicillin-binding protein 2 [Alphaproteobacteria bacterium]